MQISSHKKVNLLSGVVNFIFSFQKFMTPIKEVNNKELNPCIYAMWHAHQCCIFGLKNRKRVNVLISRSNDGEIIARATENLGFQTVRGSKGKKGSVEATIRLIDKLRANEDVAITVDGPNGPNRKAKNGVITIAKMSGAPIVPVVWYSPFINFLKIPSWDEFRYPLGYTWLVNLYGEPIYVNPDNSDEEDEAVRIQLENTLLDLEKRVPEEWKKAWGFKWWK